MRINAPLRLLFAFLFGFTVAFVAACGPAPKACGPSTCMGCCDENGECLAGTALFECGAGGNACVRCEANLACNGGACTLIDGGEYDASFPDTPDGSFRDAGVFDAGPVPDAGVDAGVDAGRPDSGTMDAGADAGRPDSGTMDAGVDAGRPDAGADAGAMDAGFDAGPPRSFMTNVQPIFDNKCGECHAWGYANTVNAMTSCGGAGNRLIVPSNLATSVLWQKIGGTPPCGQSMPRAGAMNGPLTATELDVIREWILQGALNN